MIDFLLSENETVNAWLAKHYEGEKLEFMINALPILAASLIIVLTILLLILWPQGSLLVGLFFLYLLFKPNRKEGE